MTSDCKKNNMNARGGAVEVYNRARYFTVTGQHVEGTPETINDRQAELDAFMAELWPPKAERPKRPAQPNNVEDADLIDLALRASNGAKFKALWHGDSSAYGGDESAADQALCNLLAWWTNRDAARIDRMFRQSGRMRDKWDRDDYRARTIDKAVESVTDGGYSPRTRVDTSGLGTDNGADVDGESASSKDETPPAGAVEQRPPAESQASKLIRIATDAGADVFHDGDDGYAIVRVGGRRETLPLGGRAARHWLLREWHLRHGGVPSSQAVVDAIAMLSARARFDGPQRTVSLRSAWHDGAIYIDRADDTWQAIEVTQLGWRVVEAPPVYFRRSGGMRALPPPATGGDIRELRQYVNVANDDDYGLLLSWLIGAMHPAGPYPILIFNGEQGTAKSFTSRVVRRFVDPNKAELRAEPRNVEDLMIAAANGWVIALDNVSSLRPWLSDALCRMATGGGFSTRTLYENSDETIFEAQRPLLLNGIEDFATRDDLNDRAIVLTLPVIDDARRRAESEVWAEFNQAQPRMFGALLDALVLSLRSADMRLSALPRMADFATRAYAAAPALRWSGERFIEAYSRNRRAGAEAAIDASVAVSALVALVTSAGAIENTAGMLLLAIGEKVEPAARPKDDWPKSPRAMTGLLKRYAPALRRNGIAVEQLARTNGQRRWRLSVSGTQPSQPPEPSWQNQNEGDGTESNRHADGMNRHQPSPKQGSFEPEHDGRDGRDGLDACSVCGAISDSYTADGEAFCASHTPAGVR